MTTCTVLDVTVWIETWNRRPFPSKRTNRSPGFIRMTLEICFASDPVMAHIPLSSLIFSTKKRLKIYILPIINPAIKQDNFCVSYRLERGNPVLSIGSWIPALRSATAGMTSFVAGLIIGSKFFFSPGQQQGCPDGPVHRR